MLFRSVWQEIVSGLGPIPSPRFSCSAGLSSLTTEELRAFANRTARIEEKWNYHAGPTHTRQVAVQPNAGPCENPILKVRLISDNIHILCLRSQGVECWNIVSSKCIWSLSEAGRNLHDFDAQLASDGRHVNIILAGWTSAPLDFQ